MAVAASSSKFASSSSSPHVSSSTKMSSKTTKTYTYKSSGGDDVDSQNVMIEYHADLSSLHRLEVCLNYLPLKALQYNTIQFATLI